jgi:hypothetical protein
MLKGSSTMIWKECPESSSIARIGYDSEANVLAVGFRRGDTYNYLEVPEAVFERMECAESKGRYLVNHIKGTFPYQRA